MIDPVPPVSRFKSKSGLQRIVCAARYSMDGFGSAWKGEAAFRQEIVVGAAATAVALVLPLPALQRLLLIAVLLMVLIVELMNSAIEAVVDRISLEPHPLSKNAKDFGSAAVMLACLLATATWVVILWPLLMG